MEKAASSGRQHPKGARFGSWTAPDGWPLRRMDWAPAKGAKRRGRLLFANGRGDFIEKYLDAYRHWRAQGWAVTAFDWRGQGGSQAGPDGARFAFESFDPLIDDLAHLLAIWRAEGKGEERAPHVAIGHSMGGHLLLRTIVERRPALDAAVLIAPMIGVNSAPTPAWLAPAVANMMCTLGLGPSAMWKTPAAMRAVGSQRQRNLTMSDTRYRDELFWWERQPDFNLGAPTWGWMRAAFRSAEAFTAGELNRVKLPILILAAEKDRLVSHAEIKRAARALPDAELACYSDAAHEILRDDDPVRDAALARIDAFLDAQRVRGPDPQ